MTFEGTVTSTTAAEGSKSERPAPLLVTESATHRLHVIGENPFEQPTLAALIGKRVRVTGELRDGVVRASAIEVLP